MSNLNAIYKQARQKIDARYQADIAKLDEWLKYSKELGLPVDEFNGKVSVLPNITSSSRSNSIAAKIISAINHAQFLMPVARPIA